MLGSSDYVCIYYARLKEVSGQSVLCDERDKKKILDILRDEFRGDDRMLCGYCVLDNEVHVVFRVSKSPDLKQHLNHLVQQFKEYYREVDWYRDIVTFQTQSILLEDMASMWEYLRQLHELPVKAGIARRVGDYWWCSYHCFTGKHPYKLIPVEALMNHLDQNQQEAVKIFRSLHRKKVCSAPL